MKTNMRLFYQAFPLWKTAIISALAEGLATLREGLHNLYLLLILFTAVLDRVFTSVCET